MKSEIRIPNSERIPKPKVPRGGIEGVSCLGFWISSFGFLSSFVIRHSSFLALFAFASLAFAQNAPHIGYVYPAGGRQGATFQIVVGGQFLGSVSNAFVSGAGVQSKVIEFNRPLNQKEFNDLRDKLKVLQDKRQANRRSPNPTNAWTSADEKEIADIGAKILKNPPNRQGNPAIAETITVEITLATNAAPGEREIRLATPNGLSNPLLFCVSQLPEVSEPAAKSTGPDIERFLERLGKKPVPAKSESRITLPAIVNGQIMPGAVDRYRFAARKGQRLVVAVSARRLIPYLADAVPGWFQATLALYDAKGRELAYDDDFRFSPDPVLVYDIARDGEYVIEIKDSIYRGREDFVYRIAIGELPFVTSIFPLGGKASETTSVELKGWNLPTNQYWTVAPGEFPLHEPERRSPDRPVSEVESQHADQEIGAPSMSAVQGFNTRITSEKSLPATQERGEGEGEGRPKETALEDQSVVDSAAVVDTTQPHLLSPALSSTSRRRGRANVELAPGVHSVFVSNNNRISNLVPFAVDTLPECLEQEPNNSREHAQQVTLPLIVNGRIDQPGDSDVFSFEGDAGSEIVAEVNARRLNSPLDSVLRLTDAGGLQIAFNDDNEDKGAGLETHHADSYLRATLHTNGIYFLHLGDTQHKGGAEYAYRLRISPPRPDFELRVVPSSLSARAGMSVPLTVFALRKDGFTNEIALVLQDAPKGFTLSGARVPANQDQVRLTLTVPPPMPQQQPINLNLEGRALIQGNAVFRSAVPADDMMQAFAYRHLVPAKELKALAAGRGLPPWRILSATPVKIPAGGTVRVSIGPTGPKFGSNFQLELSEPPEGITLGEVVPGQGEAKIELRCDAAKVKPGLTGNLIVNVFRPTTPESGKPQATRRSAPLGTLPAIPFEIVPPP
jgi:hypothetical protein